MKRTQLSKLFACFAFLVTSYVVAEPATPNDAESEEPKKTFSSGVLQADWVFSGMVINESGERYAYYFQIQRDNTQFHALATLIDGRSQEILLFENAIATIKQPDVSNWQVGRAFLQFNPINNSWVFGVKTKAKRGFNFKVDMLKQAGNKPTIQDLRLGIELLVSQTGRLNGHLQAGEDSKEQFVTAPKAWFRQIWVSKLQGSLHPFIGILCQFNDGSGFYSVNLPEADALKGAVAGWRNIEGTAVSMSQFVTLQEEKSGSWHIHIASPKICLSLQDVLPRNHEKHPLIAGVTDGVMPGFCTISQDEIGQQ